MTLLAHRDTALPADVRELVILWVARWLNTACEWVKHVAPARQAGIPDNTIEALRRGDEPSWLTPVQTDALAVARSVLERRSIPSAIQDSLIARLGLSAVVELVILAGFYQTIAGVIFAFAVPLPAGEGQPFGRA